MRRQFESATVSVRRAETVSVVTADACSCRAYIAWHDRPVFHLLVEPSDRDRYVIVTIQAFAPRWRDCARHPRYAEFVDTRKTALQDVPHGRGTRARGGHVHHDTAQFTGLKLSGVAHDETQAQALDRTQPIFPFLPGVPERRSHDYKRNGTIDLSAALNLATGEVAHQLTDQHRAIEFQPALEAQLADIHTLRDDAQARGWDSETARHERVVASIDRHLRRLENHA